MAYETPPKPSITRSLFLWQYSDEQNTRIRAEQTFGFDNTALCIYITHYTVEICKFRHVSWQIVSYFGLISIYHSYVLALHQKVLAVDKCGKSVNWYPYSEKLAISEWKLSKNEKLYYRLCPRMYVRNRRIVSAISCWNKTPKWRLYWFSFQHWI